MKKKSLQLLLVAAILCLPVLNSHAQTEIRTAEEFSAIRNNLGGNYVLMNDIDMSGITNWTPIGMPASHTGLGTGNNFTGTLDGQGYAIKNLTYSYTGAGMTGGLFARIVGGTIKNLELRGFKITGINNASPATHTAVGALTAVLGNNAAVEQVSVIGCTLTGGAGGVGGEEVGGLAGRTNAGNNNIPRIKDCFIDTTTKISGTNKVGGLIGNIDQPVHVQITNCYVAATIESASAATAYGVVGAFNGTIATFSIVLKSVFVIAQAAPGTTLQPFCSQINSGSTAYFACKEYFPSVTPANTKTLAELQNEATYTDAGWDFDMTWTWDESGTYVFPILSKKQLSEEWNEIRTPEDLRAIGKSSVKLRMKYKLMNDIDFAGVTGWVPLGVETLAPGTTVGDDFNFFGTFDGQGYTLSNITVVNEGKAFTSALFTKLSAGAVVKNLTLENVNITGGNITGGLTGTMIAGGNITVQNVYVSGKIKGKGEVGGITGRYNNANAILIKDCSVNVEITGTDFTHGESFDNQGVTACTSALVNVGGIIGSAYSGQNATIENCLVQGRIIALTTGTNELNPGGLIGMSNNGTATIHLKNSVVAAEITGGSYPFWGSKNLSANNVINVVSCYYTEINNNDLFNQVGGAFAPLEDLPARQSDK